MINGSILRRQPYSHPGRVLQRCVTPGAVTVSWCAGLGAHRAPTHLSHWGHGAGVAGMAGDMLRWPVTC